MFRMQDAASAVLQTAASEFQHPTFPCALIAGDVVILHLLHRLQLLDKVKVVFVDTFHLFPETHTFLQQCEVRPTVSNPLDAAVT